MATTLANLTQQFRLSNLQIQPEHVIYAGKTAFAFVPKY